MQILQSAAKIVFVLLAVTACAGFFLGKLEAKDFMLLASMAFAFYFASPSATTVTEGGVSADIK